MVSTYIIVVHHFRRQKNQMTSSNANEFVSNPIFAGSPEHKPEANSVTTVDRLQLKTTPDLPSGDVIDPVDNSQYGDSQADFYLLL